MILKSIPREVCILRLSAIGDTCHVVPVVRTLQQAWPETRFTWIIGRVEAKLLGHIPDIEFITFDKRQGFRELLRVRALLRARRFDLLLHMQHALRASLLSSYVRARIKLGFDRARARELQWLFTTHRIAAREREHVLDSFFGFAETLGVHDRILQWNIPIPEEARTYAARLAGEQRRVLVISPCSSHPRRNWRAEYYAQIVDHAVRAHRLHVILAGGPSRIEREMGEQIVQRVQERESVTNNIGQDTLLQMLALLERAEGLISPDSGPVHMATAVGTPVIGLYAATNPERSGPYFSRGNCVNRYDEAARKFLGKPASAIPWTKKIEKPGVMDLITPEDVIRKLDALMRQRGRRPRQWA